MIRDAPIVLDKQRRAPVVNVTCRVTGEQAAIRGGACEEVFDWRGRNGAVSGREGVAAEEFETSSRSPVGATAETITMFFDTKFNDVPSDRVRDMVYKLIAVIGSLDLGPIETPDSRHRKSKKT